MQLSAFVDRATSELVVRVADAGPGLGGRTMASLLQDFGGEGGGGGGGARREDGGGARSSGMGIPIGARLAALMGGSLMVGGREDGRAGTEFTLRLSWQVVSPGSAPDDVLVRPSAPLVSLAGARVLVVDDSAANRRLAVFLLRQLGCVTSDVDDGDGALPAVRAAAAAGAPFDAVLMDIMMERMNGDAALKELRAAGEALPVIVSSGNATAVDAERYMGLGFADVLPKPFKTEMLKASLAGVLGAWAAARA